MAILPIYTLDQAVLRKRARPVRKVDDELIRLGMDMIETMHNANGVGLAANQVGSTRRIIVVDVSDVHKDSEEIDGDTNRIVLPEVAKKPIVMLNPEIVTVLGSWSSEEGCLSIPEIRDEVGRPEFVKVRYKDLDFRDQEFEATDLLSRVILHEVDHLNGVLFIDRVGRVKQKLMRGRLNRIRRGEFETKYPTIAANAVIEEE